MSLPPHPARNMTRQTNSQIFLLTAVGAKLFLGVERGRWPGLTAKRSSDLDAQSLLFSLVNFVSWDVYPPDRAALDGHLELPRQAVGLVERREARHDRELGRAEREPRRDALAKRCVRERLQIFRVVNVVRGHRAAEPLGCVLELRAIGRRAEREVVVQEHERDRRIARALARTEPLRACLRTLARAEI